MTAETLHEHDEEKAKHAYDIEENELHHKTAKSLHEQHHEHEDVFGDEHFKEKGERREGNVIDSELKNEINDELEASE